MGFERFVQSDRPAMVHSQGWPSPFAGSSWLEGGSVPSGAPVCVARRCRGEAGNISKHRLRCRLKVCLKNSGKQSEDRNQEEVTLATCSGWACLARDSSLDVSWQPSAVARYVLLFGRRRRREAE